MKLQLYKMWSYIKAETNVKIHEMYRIEITEEELKKEKDL